MQSFSFPYQQSLHAQLPDWQKDLVDAAAAAANKAYAPYSRFRVGAAILLESGEVRIGFNHENAAFPAGICAERAVLGALEMDEDHRIRAMAIAYKTDKKAVSYPALAPCGICRQSILEAQLHQKHPIIVIMSSPEGEVNIVEDATHLLPFYFSGEFL